MSGTAKYRPVWLLLLLHCGADCGGKSVTSASAEATGGSVATIASGGSTRGTVASATGGAIGGQVVSSATGGANTTGGTMAGSVGTRASGGTSGGSVPATATGGTNVFTVPINHRTAEPQCSVERAAGPLLGSLPFRGECGQDSDCTAGTNGRCLMSFPGGPYCSYDDCFSDTDCSNKLACVCRDSASSFDANTCMPSGGCLVDTDCGPNGFCSPSLVAKLDCMCPSNVGGTYDNDRCGHGYFCHTQKDSCVNDSDCNGTTCAYDMVDNRWSCYWPGCPI